jgi:hypothetical protein
VQGELEEGKKIMNSLIEQIERLIDGVPGDNRVFKMSKVTLDDNFGPKNRGKYPDELIEKVSEIPVTIDNSIEDNIIYLVNEAKPERKINYCPDCGDDVDGEGQCVFCFATANIEG